MTILRPVQSAARAFALVLMIMATQAQSNEAAGPTVVLVRHAEKAAEPAGDPSLTVIGVARAQALAASLRDAHVTAILTTQFKRTRETAQAIAAATGVTPEVVPAERGKLGEHVTAVVAAVRRQTAGTVLVIGHGNTVNKIIEALGGPALPDICEATHSRLFVLNTERGKARLVEARYGAAEPALGADCK